ncbi:chemotaxis protein CheW [Acetonema longum]|uniref:CheW protein n=1 Tax=Acetonema longum DSM 6540 TaxID=1009370 RepID=F7NIK0_9FIRM|nr:chemotaxis protein CheW [Acetonema longum]EGO64146.1 CheW protein [Acetonema longum DSM 6540]
MEKVQQQSAQELQLVIFKLDKEEYGLPITKVQEINKMVSITKLPHTPVFVEGIINLRGRVIPIVDLRKRFQLSASDHNEDSRIIIIEISGQTLGVIVDAVTEVVRLQANNVEPPPPAFILDSQYIHGVGKLEDRLIILLNLDKILTTQETIELKKMAVEE